jgi:hypothetical protein
VIYTQTSQPYDLSLFCEGVLRGRIETAVSMQEGRSSDGDGGTFPGCLTIPIAYNTG